MGENVRELRILIADEQPIVRQGLRHVIEANSAWSVCGETADGNEAIAIALREEPDIAVIALSIPDAGGISVTRRIVETGSVTRILLYGGREGGAQVAAGLAAGASGYVLGTDSPQDVRAAIASLAARRRYLSPIVRSLLREIRSHGDANGAAAFTTREREVTQLIAAGQSNRQIAQALGKSIKTIESHRASAMRKAGVNCVAQLVLFAVKHQMAEV